MCLILSCFKWLHPHVCSSSHPSPLQWRHNSCCCSLSSVWRRTYIGRFTRKKHNYFAHNSTNMFSQTAQLQLAKMKLTGGKGSYRQREGKWREAWRLSWPQNDQCVKPFKPQSVHSCWPQELWGDACTFGAAVCCDIAPSLPPSRKWKNETSKCSDGICMTYIRGVS